ncbi:hypothetical protein ACFQU2_32010 [Siccirubricoccus deserti]
MPDLNEGTPAQPGVTADAAGVNVAVVAPDATLVEFCLFDATGDTELARYPLPARSGEVWHGYFSGIAPGARYGLRAHGAWAPEADSGLTRPSCWSTPGRGRWTGRSASTRGSAFAAPRRRISSRRRSSSLRSRRPHRRRQGPAHG